MIRLTQINMVCQKAFTTLTLDYEARTKSRQKVQLDNGMDAGLFLERGRVLKQGDILSSETGDTVKVLAAAEAVSTVYADTPKELLLACYHLGNRHVSLEIREDRLRYRQDHVLDDMIYHLGLVVVHDLVPFMPESGAYQAGSHHHGHGEHHAC
jgi:urease accessory protein